MYGRMSSATRSVTKRFVSSEKSTAKRASKMNLKRRIERIEGEMKAMQLKTVIDFIVIRECLLELDDGFCALSVNFRNAMSSEFKEKKLFVSNYDLLNAI